MSQEINEFNIKQKVIVVTGATGILGEAFVKSLSDADARVVIIGRNEEVGNARTNEITDKGKEALFVKCDVLNKKDLEAARDLVVSKWGRIDGLVNAAGGNIPEAVIAPGADIFEMDIDALKRAFDLNLYGTLLPTCIFGKAMSQNDSGARGSIINISSMAAQTAITRVLGYSMAKAAIDNFTRWMSVELAQRYGDKIRMNAIAPGFFVTHQNRRLLVAEDGGYTARGEAVIRSTPFKRFGEPEELTGTLLWLLSDASRFVSGEVICVDGGFHIFSGV